MRLVTEYFSTFSEYSSGHLYLNSFPAKITYVLRLGLWKVEGNFELSLPTAYHENEYIFADSTYFELYVFSFCRRGAEF